MIIEGVMVVADRDLLLLLLLLDWVFALEVVPALAEDVL